MRVRWVLTGVRGRACAAAAIRTDASEKLADGAQVALDVGAVEGVQAYEQRWQGRLPWRSVLHQVLYFATAVHGIADPNAAPILDAQIAGWLRAKHVVSLRVNNTRDYESYLQLLKEWGQRSGRAPAQVEAGIFHLATGR